MIATVSGVLAEREGESIVVQTDGGVGYAGDGARRAWPQRLPAPGGRLSLYTELVVKEDGWSLFGFDRADRADGLPAAARRERLRAQAGAGAPLGARSRADGAQHPGPGPRRARARSAGSGGRRRSGWCSSCRTASPTSRWSRRPRPGPPGPRTRCRRWWAWATVRAPRTTRSARRWPTGAARGAGATHPAGAAAARHPGREMIVMSVPARTAEWHCTRCGTTNRKLVPADTSAPATAASTATRSTSWSPIRPVRWRSRLDD